MSDNSGWEYVHSFLVKIADGYYQVPESWQMSVLEARITLDTITELVHEIERCEEVIIKQADELTKLMTG